MEGRQQRNRYSVRWYKCLLSLSLTSRHRDVVVDSDVDMYADQAGLYVDLLNAVYFRCNIGRNLMDSAVWSCDILLMQYIGYGIP